MATNRRISTNDGKAAAWVFSLVFFVFCICSLTLHKEQHDVIVKSSEMMQSVHGTNGSISTGYTYLVYTDDGTYTIEMSGMWAHPELIGKFSDGDTLRIVTRGRDLPYFGMYRTIVSIKQE